MCPNNAGGNRGPAQRWKYWPHHALEPEGDELTRRWLYSILAREERVLRTVAAR